MPKVLPRELAMNDATREHEVVTLIDKIAELRSRGEDIAADRVARQLRAIEARAKNARLRRNSGQQ